MAPLGWRGCGRPRWLVITPSRSEPRRSLGLVRVRVRARR